MAANLREIVAQLDDDTVHDLVRALVEGLLEGVAEHVTDSILRHLSMLGEPATPETPEPEPAPPAQPEPVAEPEPPARRDHDGSERTCEICGRVGTRRFIETDTGWRCSRTATACPGNRTDPQPTPRGPEEFCTHCMQHHDDHDRDELACPTKGGFSKIHRFEAREVFPPPPPAEPEPPAKPSPAPGITARCQDCPRTWSLTGRVLQMAVDSHELKHSHIVDTLEVASA